METNARLIAENHELYEKINRLVEENKGTLYELEAKTAETNDLRVSEKIAAHKAETNEMGAKLIL